MEYKAVQVLQQLRTKPLRLLSILIFLVSLGEGLTAPAIPLLGLRLGASYSYIGFFMTGYALAYAAMTITAGRMSDLWGRKKILLFSLVVAVIAATGYYFAFSARCLLVFRTLEGASRGILWPAAAATIADHSTAANRDQAAGRFSAAYGSGVAIGNLLGGYLMEYINFSLVFPPYPVLSLLAFLLILTFFNNSAEVKESAAGHRSNGLAWQEIKKIWPICYVGFAYSGFLYSISGLLSLVAAHYRVSSMGIGVIFALFWCCRLVAFLGAGHTVKAFGRRPVLLLGIALAACAACTFILAEYFLLLLLAAVIGGIGTGIMYPMSIAIVADSSSPGYRGFNMGFWELVAAVGMIMQTALAGLLAQYGGVKYTYLFTMGTCLSALLVAFFFIAEPRRLQYPLQKRSSDV